MKLIYSKKTAFDKPDFDRDEVYTVPELALPTEGVLMPNGARRPYIFFNMVSSIDGKAITSAQSAAGLGSETDQYMMGRLRAAADGVMAGAGTFRHDPFNPTVRPHLVEERARYFPDAPQPIGIIISSNGDLPVDKKFWQAGRDLRALFLGEQASPEREKQWQQYARVFRVLNEGNNQPDMAEVLHLIYSELGVRRLLVEGGPNLNYTLITRNFADELFWTLAPKIVGGKENTIVSGALLALDSLVNLKLISIYQNDHELFMRYGFTSDKD